MDRVKYTITLFVILFFYACHSPINKILYIKDNYYIVSIEGSNYKNFVSINSKGYTPIVYNVKSIKGTKDLLIIESFRKNKYYKIKLSKNESIDIIEITYQKYLFINDSIPIIIFNEDYSNGVNL